MEIWLQSSAAAAAIGTLALIWWQLRIQSRQAMFEALTRLHDVLTGTELQGDLRLIYAGDPEVMKDPKSAQVLQSIERVLNIYDLIGFRAKQGVLDLVLQRYKRIGERLCLESLAARLRCW